MDTINVIVEKVSKMDRLVSMATSPAGLVTAGVLAAAGGLYLGLCLSRRRDAKAGEKFQQELLAEIANLEAELASK